MIGKGDALDATFAAPIDPGLEQVDCIRPEGMGLGVRVVIHFADHGMVIVHGSPFQQPMDR
jgi:hypothetical protein